MAHEARGEDLLADLTPAQAEAVTHFTGPLLILAGAGSGKTRVITRRVAWLLQQGVRHGNILAITFTNKAAGEMRQRVEAIVPESRVWVSTFHSFGARVLRQYAERVNLDRNFTIYDMTDRNKVVKDSLEVANLDSTRFTPERIGAAISKAKNQLLTPGEYARKANDFFTQTVAKVYFVYDKRLRDANAMDFDDLLYLPALALRHDEELRGELDARFRFILIDEYQDTNSAQYEIARRLSIDNPNLCVVGDPDQCLPPGTMVETPDGPRPIETIRDGDTVMAGVGWGKAAPMTVDKVMVNPFRGLLQVVRVEGDHEFRATLNHVCFARQDERAARHQKCRTPAINPSHERSAAEFHGWDYDGFQPQPGAYRTAVANLLYDAETCQFQFLKRGVFSCYRAGNLQPGMLVPVLENGRVVERRIESVELEQYEGPVYDLSVPGVHNFAAGGVLVHNSIYKWRGSDIRNILDFERDFPDARVITLDRNYRSTKAILHAASTLIDNNVQRKKKSLVTDNPQGVPVRILTFDNGLDEADLVVKQMAERVKAREFAYRDFAVFLRINALSRTLESAFVKHGVPFQIVRGLAFFERKENRDVVAYLRLLVNPLDNISFLRVVNEPARGIGKVSLDHLQTYAEPRELPLLSAAGEVKKIPQIKGKAAKGLFEFHKTLTDLRASLELAPDEVIRQVLDRTGYRAQFQGSTDQEDQERLANIEELITAAKQFWAEDESRTIGDFLEQITLASDVDGWDERQDCVSVMTLHAAKGLEFPVVYMLAVEQGLLPHERSLAKDDEVEEERRLCFVGMTRAMKELNLCHSRLREFRGQALYAIPSMFLDELPADVERVDLSAHAGGNPALDAWRGKGDGWNDTGLRPQPVQPVRPVADAGGFGVGVLVSHPEYGRGRILEISGHGSLRRFRVMFATGGEKTLIANQAKLTVVKTG